MSELRFHQARAGWVVLGPADRLIPGAELVVPRGEGKRTVRLVAVGAARWQVEGETMAYGYFEHGAAAPPPPGAVRATVVYLGEHGDVRYDPGGVNSPLARLLARRAGLLPAHSTG